MSTTTYVLSRNKKTIMWILGINIIYSTYWNYYNQYGVSKICFPIRLYCLEQLETIKNSTSQRELQPSRVCYCIK